MNRTSEIDGFSTAYYALQYVCFGIVVVVVLSSAWYQIIADDTWWHLANGRAVISNWEIPRTDFLSFTHQGKRWLNWEWLTGVGFYLVYDLFGPIGLQGMRLSLVTLLVLLVWTLTGPASVQAVTKRIDEDESSGFLVVRLSIVLTLVLTMIGRSLDRPHTVGHLLLALTLLLSCRLVKDPSWAKAVVLAFVVAVWTQFHPSWLLGQVTIGATVVDYVVRNRAAASRHKHLLAFVASAQGLILVAAGVQRGYSSSVATLFQAHLLSDWQSLPTLLFHPSQSLSWPLVAFSIFIATYIVFAIRNYRSLCSFIGLLSLLMLVFSILYFRFAPFFIILSSPFVVRWLVPHARRLAEKPIRRFLSVSLVGVVVFALVATTNLSQQKRFGFGIDRPSNSADAVDFMSANSVAGNLLANDLPAHSYASYVLWPEVKVFIDGRVPQVFSLEFMGVWNQVLTPQGLGRLIDGYPIDIVLLVNPRTRRTRKLSRALRDRQDFTLVYVNLNSALWLRKERNLDRAAPLPSLEEAVPGLFVLTPPS